MRPEMRLTERGESAILRRLAGRLNNLSTYVIIFTDDDIRDDFR